MAPIFQLSFVVVLAHYVTVSHQKGSTQRLEEIFKGRCLDYILTRSDSLASVSDVDCDELWSKFASAWRDTQSCGDDAISYANLFNNIPQKLPKDKLLFWSGTAAFAHKLSDNGRRYVTLEDTLVGYIVNGLAWCGQPSGSGINYDSCPAYGSCTAEPLKNFWLEASRWFASQAAGEIRVVLNGSNPSRRAYSKDSIFGSLEVPSLQSKSVRKLTSIVVHDLDKPKIESCISRSLLELRSDIQVKHITFECFDNPEEVKLLLCLDSPSSPECEPVTCDYNVAVGLGQSKHGSTWAHLTSVTAAATLLMTYFVFCM